jgi:hypothetical protein
MNATLTRLFAHWPLRRSRVALSVNYGQAGATWQSKLLTGTVSKMLKVHITDVFSNIDPCRHFQVCAFLWMASVRIGNRQQNKEIHHRSACLSSSKFGPFFQHRSPQSVSIQTQEFRVKRKLPVGCRFPKSGRCHQPHGQFHRSSCGLLLAGRSIVA